VHGRLHSACQHAVIMVMDCQIQLELVDVVLLSLGVIAQSLLEESPTEGAEQVVGLHAVATLAAAHGCFWS
jgi:hypothetical protein